MANIHQEHYIEHTTTVIHDQGLINPTVIPYRFYHYQQRQLLDSLGQAMFSEAMFSEVVNNASYFDKLKVIQLNTPITCPITFEEIQFECYELPCGHQFSADICTWVNEKNNCPLCRKVVDKCKWAAILR